MALLRDRIPDPPRPAPEFSAGALIGGVLHSLDMPGDPPVPFQSADSSDLRPAPSPTEYELIPFQLGDGIDYPGSPMQWFAIPKMYYEMMRQWANPLHARLAFER